MYQIVIILSYDGAAFHQHADSNHGHYITSLANSNGSPFAVCGQSESTYTNKTEIYDVLANTWTVTAPYPYHYL